MRGAIALDIDGTLTDATHRVPQQIFDYLKQLSNEGWLIAFITGRPFDSGHRLVEPADFPHYFGCYNGASIYQMPEKRQETDHQLDASSIAHLQELTGKLHLHTTIDSVDHCYFLADAPIDKARQEHMHERCLQLDSFDEIPFDKFSLAQTFGPPEALFALEPEIRKLGLATSVVKDWICPNTASLMISHAHANKGQAVRYLRRHLQPGAPVIAAGDDLNDLLMIVEADIGIAMGTAPQDVLNAADIIAPPSTELGILQGLREALR